MSETEKIQEKREPRTSGLAEASMVLGVLSVLSGFCVSGLGFVFGTAAVIAGLSALLQVKMSHRLLQGRLLAMVGIITGAIVAPSVVILELRHHRHTYHLACRMVCGTNMAALAKAMVRYANDYDRPVSSEWCDTLLRGALAEDKNFICRGSATPKGQSSYAMNKNIVGMKPSDIRSDVVLLFETSPGWNQHGGPEILTTENHAGKGCNVAFVDTHVSFIVTLGLSELKWEAEESE